MAVLEDACVPSLDSIIHARKYLDFMLRDHDFFINKQKIFSKPSLKERRNKPTRAKGKGPVMDEGSMVRIPSLKHRAYIGKYLGLFTN